MADAVWNILNSLAVGGAVWLATILVFALLGELGLPFTCPVIESLLVFTGFQIVHGGTFIAALPLLAVAYAGRLIGSLSAYRLSARIGTGLLLRYGQWVRVTPERIESLRIRLSTLVVPTIMLARFTPGLTVLTSFVSGVSRMRGGQFLKAVAGQLVAWETAFIAAGALGGLAVRSVDPTTYPRAIVLIIAISITAGALGSWLIFNCTRRRSQPPLAPGEPPTTARSQ
ncbi:MAG: hypothetical protein JXA58_02625 [Dehalococcoidia bacterium]|nr:hypothetical protein [Dehalococcoidia bacterium]